MNVIFLDIDGVLNARPFVEGRDTRDWAGLIDPLAVARLNSLVGRAAAKIVISSSWRCQMPIARIAHILLLHGHEGEIIGATPRLLASRGAEIQAWLDDTPSPPRAFVILDDVDDMAHLSPYLVLTTWEEGLLDVHIDEALAVLSRPRNGSTP